MCEETPIDEVDAKCPCGCEYTMSVETSTWWRCFDCNRYIKFDPIEKSIVLLDSDDDKIKARCGKCHTPIAKCEDHHLDIDEYGMMHTDCAKRSV